MKTSIADMPIIEDCAPRRVGALELLSDRQDIGVIDPEHSVCWLPRAPRRRLRAVNAQPASQSNVQLAAVGTPPSFDPFFAPAVTASAEEIRYAQELRRQLEQRYLNRPSTPVSFWCVGVD